MFLRALNGSQPDLVKKWEENGIWYEQTFEKTTTETILVVGGGVARLRGVADPTGVHVDAGSRGD